MSIQQAVARDALKDMFNNQHFDICTIDKVARVLRVNIKQCPEYDILSALHCVKYREMSPEVKESLPVLIQHLFNQEEVTDSAIDYMLPGGVRKMQQDLDDRLTAIEKRCSDKDRKPRGLLGWLGKGD